MTDGQNSTIKVNDLVNVPLENGTTTIGIIIRKYAENSAVIAYTNEHGQAVEKMVFIDDPDHKWTEMSAGN